MNQKSSFVLISVFLVSMVTMLYIFFNNGKDDISKTSPKVAYENVTYEHEKEDNIINERKNISDNIQKKPQTMKNNLSTYMEKRKKRQHINSKSAVVKQYEKEDTNIFISRIENEIEASNYLEESVPYTPVNENTYQRTNTSKIKHNRTLAAHKRMLLSHRSTSNDFQDDYE